VGITYEIGPFRLDPAAKALTQAGAPVELGPRAVAVLASLVESAREYVPKTRLIDEAWPGVVVQDANLAVQISAIRRVLAGAPGGENWIETLARRGYRFVGPVTRLFKTSPRDPGVTNPRCNLPEPATSFVGREREVAELQKLLAEHRLLTLTGSGGVGKTRLALRVAATAADRYSDGVWLVELAALSDPGLVPHAVIAALGLKEQPGRSATERLVEHLQARRLLLVLDNVEHLLPACVRLTDTLLRQCAQVTVLVTSRQQMAISGELTYRVPSLAMPDAGPNATAQSLAQCESVQLFNERARLQRPHFAVTDQSAPGVASICRRLDGIPLAIELAAARVRSLSISEIDAKLDQRFRLLTDGSPAALLRQQTLRALIDWSYDLLSASEQALFERLSVFAGSWVLAAAEQVCSDERVGKDSVFELLTSLADKSLVLAEERGDATRYRLLETVRQYARDRLREGGGEAHWRDQHLAYFVALAQGVEPMLRGAAVQEGLERLEVEHDNLRLAMDWAESEGGDSIAGLRIAAAMWWFWESRGHLREGRGRLSRLLAAASDTQALAIRAKALRGAGALARVQADYVAAEALHRESLDIRRALGDQGGIALALGSLGAVAVEQGDYDAARALQEESLAIQRKLGDRANVANVLNNLGEVAYYQADYATARTRMEESLEIYRELGNPWGLSFSTELLGRVASAEGSVGEALALQRQALLIRRELSNQLGIVGSLEALASLAVDMGAPDRAARIWGSAERLREEIGAPISPAQRLRYDSQVDSARAVMSDGSAFASAWRGGRAMTLEQTIEYALSDVDA